MFSCVRCGILRHRLRHQRRWRTLAGGLGTRPASPMSPSDTRARMRDVKLADEAVVVQRVMSEIPFDSAANARIDRRARELVAGVRSARRRFGGLDGFLEEYQLTTPEGVALMCLAEALLRIPDAETADRLIADKIGSADWDAHLGGSDSWFVNASTWALMLTGRIVDDEPAAGTLPSFGQMVAKLGEPVIRAAVGRAMRVLGTQFVLGRRFEEALERAEEDIKAGYTHSFDMLGEGARTAEDASRYFESYARAIERIGTASAGAGTQVSPGISVKLSALFPRYEHAQRARAVPALSERLRELALACRAHDIGLTVDAEEADRLDLSLDIIEQVFRDRGLGDWAGFGLAVQAYQKRALDVVEWVTTLAGDVGRPISVRLVKGAYWDSEIKWAQVRGLPGYPVFTRKVSTDASYLACAARLFAAGDFVYPMMATHNAHTVAAVLELSAGRREFEFQRLHGMGEPLYHQIVGPEHSESVRCRIYAPVGSHEDLLPYLVRRLLENGANTSFVNRLRDDAAPVEAIVADPVAQVRKLDRIPHPKIPQPVDLYQPDRKNSLGLDLADGAVVQDLYRGMSAALETEHRAAPLIGGETPESLISRAVPNPADTTRSVGTVEESTSEMIDAACRKAASGFAVWDRTPPADRATVLECAADLLEAHRPELMALAIREA
ncbi:MAG: bifunctional proline dehydrogenase/L-glutamate gamma-semialdehyde dehydrogenase PutA, partial [Alphaproteobacteria bacterium]|nr:bifunctional proline dehydrogenase/L-glutamate gamma-semialdehyde dehydrogenase PutA [Alphaproteobacteria bacterium]